MLERPPYCRGYATLRTVRLFIVAQASTGSTENGYVVKRFVTWRSYLTPTKVQLDPSIDVGDTRTPVRPFLIVELAWRAQHPG